ncbi:hypothetical protein [Amycolatopsis thailandensis]|uniref:hypothetical protein n=1 Tax=Amycolatopsis thailandensis TaxID=589330 RepID=UPI001177842A|nr:hypothetical protein [Amycolatopsis thailandensis]
MTGLPFEITDDQWLGAWLRARERRPGLTKNRLAEGLAHTEMPCYTINPDHRLSPADLALGRVEQTDAAFAVKDRLIGRQIPERLQVSIPNALDLAYFVSGSTEAAPDWMVDAQAMINGEIREIAKRWGDMVQLQLESPSILLAYYVTPRELWPRLTTQLAHQVAETIGVAPEVPWVLHLCYEGPELDPLVEPADLDAAVLFLNALAGALAERGTPMPRIHLPAAAGVAAPSTDPDFYAALGDLRRGIDVIAGVVAEGHPDETRTALALMTDALGAPVTAIGAACGLRQRTIAAGGANLALAASVARAWTATCTS